MVMLSEKYKALNVIMIMKLQIVNVTIFSYYNT